MARKGFVIDGPLKHLMMSLLREGRSQNEIASLMGVPKNTLSKWIKKNGLREQVKMTQEQMQASFKDSMFHHCFDREIEEKEYQYVKNEKTGKSVPKLVGVKKKVVGPDPTATKLWAINMGKWMSSNTVNTLSGGDEKRPLHIRVKRVDKEALKKGDDDE